MLGTVLTSLLASSAAVQAQLDVPSLLDNTHSITKRCEGEALPPAEFTLPLAAKVSRPPHKHAAFQALRNARGGKAQVGPYTASLAGSDLDEEYLVNITVGGQHFSVIVDTGSSDTWLAEKNFKCFSLADKPEPESTCAFGATYDPKKSKTYHKIPTENFNISYGDNEFLNGFPAKESISIAGLTVKSQTIGVVNKAAWNGDGINAGLLGLAYEDLTSVYKGNNPDNDSYATNIPYTPFFYTAIDTKVLKNPIFSIALDRGSIKAEQNSSYDPKLGYLSFGGIAPVKITGRNATVPVQKIKTKHRGTIYGYYTVDLVYGGKGLPHNSNETAILDTGTTLSYVPNDIAERHAAAFVPEATYNDDLGGYEVKCNAKAPTFSAVIGGVKFAYNKKDLILPIGKDEKGKEVCILGVQPGGTAADGSIFILGDSFLHNVVMSFNPKHEEITLNERAPY